MKFNNKRFLRSHPTTQSPRAGYAFMALFDWCSLIAWMFVLTVGGSLDYWARGVNSWRGCETSWQRWGSPRLTSTGGHPRKEKFSQPEHSDRVANDKQTSCWCRFNWICSMIIIITIVAGKLKVRGWNESSDLFKWGTGGSPGNCFKPWSL